MEVEREPGLSISLFAHLDDEQKEHFKDAYRGCKVLLDATLRKVIADKLKESYRAIDSKDVYELPNALGYLADQAGYRRALNELLKLLP